jgi:hypothetical protein
MEGTTVEVISKDPVVLSRWLNLFKLTYKEQGETKN